MKQTLRNNSYLHIIILALLAVYTLSANSLYVSLFRKYGKPYAEGPALQVPGSTSGVTYLLTDLQPSQMGGENLYAIRGYAFETARPLQKYKISVVLSDGRRNLYFNTYPVDHADMILSYSGYKPGMDGVEFNFAITQEALKPGTYHIGLLLEQVGGPNRFFISTSSSLHRTPNTLQYQPGS